MSRSVFVVFALIGILGMACNREADRAPGMTPGEGGGLSGAANPPGKIRLSPSEQEFVQNAAKGNQMEVDLANMAEDKADNANVENYAEQLERDHSDVLDDLRRLADRADLNLDTTPPAEKASMKHDKLSAASGRRFDREYISMMIDDHKTNIAEFERMQSTATGELKAFIDKTLPVMREHLQKAETLSTALGR